MAVFVVTDGGTLIDEFDVSTQVTEWVDVSATAEMKEYTPLKNGGFRQYIPGLVTATTTLVGNADYASGGVPAEFGVSDLGAQTVVSIAPEGWDSEGDRAILHRGRVSSLQAPTGGVGDVAGFRVASQGDTAQLVGYVLSPLTSRSTSGFTGTGINVAGPGSGKKAYASLHVTAASGTDLAVKIQSDDNSSFTSATDRITFSTVSAVGAQWGTVDGDLSSEDYWRAVITVASGTFTCFVGFGVTS